MLIEASAFYRHTEGARIGARFWCTCEYTVTALRTVPLDDIEALDAAGYRFQGHLYEVFVRSEQGPILLVRAQHICTPE